MEQFIKIELGTSFLLNSGICGFLELLEYSRADIEKDYKIDGQTMYVSTEFLLNNDLSNLYIKTMVNKFKDKTKFSEIVGKRNVIDSIYKKGEKLSKDDLEIVNKIFKELIQMLEKNSFKSGYIILAENKNIKHINVDMISQFKKEKDIWKSRDIYTEICDILQQSEVQEVLIFKELMYSKINMFYDNTSFFLPANLKKSIKDCYNKDFVQPIVNEICSNKAKRKRCIECYDLVSETKAISFMLDTTDDISRKKSHYWNLKPDAFVCPICAFLYTFVPLGFSFIGRDAIFINNNSSINAMYRIMKTYESKNDLDSNQSNKSKFYHIFTEQKIEMIEHKVDNIQVIVKGTDRNHYEMNVIGKDLIKKMVEGKNHLKYLERKYIKQGDKLKSIYNEVIDNILFSRSQYQLIHNLFIHELKNNGSTNYLRDILKLEIIFRGGENMDLLKKNVDNAWNRGKELRQKLTESVQEKDIDNNLRGLVYKLSNSLSVGNCEQFLDTIIRIYSGKGLPIPYIFKECYESEDMFKAIGQGFILGLKYTKFEKNNEVINNLGGEI